VTFLVDANVLSEPTKPRPHPRAIAWLRSHEREIVLDPIVLGEIRFGVLLLPAGRRRQRLDLWFAEGVRRIHCLAWDVETGLRWAELLARLRLAGEVMPVKDSMIAATALRHDLTVATRNGRDFGKAGVNVVDPFA
jgi:toxin FitB